MKLHEKILKHIVEYERVPENKKFLSGKELGSYFCKIKESKLLESLSYLQSLDYIDIQGYLDFNLNFNINSTSRGQSYKLNRQIESRIYRNSMLISLLIGVLSRLEWIGLIKKLIQIIT
jgi:hypothetical protein